MTFLSNHRLRGSQFFQSVWNCGFISGSDVNPGLATAACRAKWFHSGGGVPFYIADPFLLVRDRSLWVLAEVKRHRRHPGEIGAWEILNTEPIYRGIVISEPGVHLSYPYIFYWKGEVYCMPDRSGEGAPYVYRSGAQAVDWTRADMITPPGHLIDSTIFEHNGKWWLAATDGVLGNTNNLSLWYADSPIGPWSPHKKNPVRANDPCARSAGTPFTSSGKLYRPSQDCTHTYGGRIIFNEIVELTDKTFAERSAGSLEPDTSGPYAYGVHTICIAGGNTVIDGKRRKFSLW